MPVLSLKDRSFRVNPARKESSPITNSKSSNLGALKSFGLAGDLGNSNQKLRSNNYLELQTNAKPRQRRASYMFKNPGKGVSLYNPDIMSSVSKAPGIGGSSIRRSFMDTGKFKGMRQSSVNRESVKKDDDNNSIGTDYSDDDMKDIEYHQRNKELYKILKKIGVCVIPDPRIKTADHLPYFSIIQDDIREVATEDKRQNTRRGNKNSNKKRKTENRDFDVSHFKSVDFFSFLNAQSMMKNKKTKKSPSLQKYHKNSKYAGISGHMGQKEEVEIIEKINVIYQEGEEKLKESAHEKALLRLLESSNTGTKPFSNIPATQNSIGVAMKRTPRKSINLGSVLKNDLGDNSALNRSFLGDKISIDRGITGMQNHAVGSKSGKNEMRDFMIEQLQMNKMNKGKPKHDKTNPLQLSTGNNKKLNTAYTREKKKLELEMLKLNEKLGTTAKILNLIRYEKSPTPIYKFKEFKEKIALMQKYKDAKKKKGKNIISGRTKGKGIKSRSSIIEDYEPTDSDTDSL